MTLALSPRQNKILAKLRENKRDAFPSKFESNDHEWKSLPKGPTGPPIHQTENIPENGDKNEVILQRSKRENVDRILSLFGGSFVSPRRPQHNWRPSPPRPHLGSMKHGRNPPKFHHGRKPHGPPFQKQHGPPKHHDFHIEHDDHDDHHFFEEHNGHVDDHHDGEIIHYDDHSLNDIHDYPEYVVEYSDFDDHKFKPSPPDIHHDYHEMDFITHHSSDYHDDSQHDSQYHDDHHQSHGHGHLNGITKNSIYRDDVPFKEVSNDNDRIRPGLIPGGVKGLDPQLISFIRDKSRPYVTGLL